MHPPPYNGYSQQQQPPQQPPYYSGQQQQQQPPQQQQQQQNYYQQQPSYPTYPQQQQQAQTQPQQRPPQPPIQQNQQAYQQPPVQQSYQQPTQQPYGRIPPAQPQQQLPKPQSQQNLYQASQPQQSWQSNPNLSSTGASAGPMGGSMKPMNANKPANEWGINSGMGGAEGQQQQQQQQSSAAPFGQDIFGNPMVTQLGMQYGQKAFSQGQEYVQKNLNRWINVPHLKYYFNVSNSYVMKKLQLILFPFRHKQWSRMGRRSEQTQSMIYRPPRDDLNSPDMYIPVMGFVTYVLIIGIMMGQGNKFHPEVLGVVSSAALTVTVFEIMAIKLGCYLLSISAEVPWLDLMSFCGYQFVPIIATLLTMFFTSDSSSLEYFAFLYFVVVAYGFFLVRSIKYFILPDAATQMAMANTGTASMAGMSNSSQKKRKLYFLFMIALFNSVCSAFLCFNMV